MRRTKQEDSVFEARYCYASFSETYGLSVPWKGFAPRRVLKKVEPLDSKTDDLLQVTDLLTGGVNHRLGPPAGERKQQLRRNSRARICRTVNPRRKAVLKTRAVQTLRDRRASLELREASGLRRVHRRFF